MWCQVLVLGWTSAHSSIFKSMDLVIWWNIQVLISKILHTCSTLCLRHNACLWLNWLCTEAILFRSWVIFFNLLLNMPCLVFWKLQLFYVLSGWWWIEKAEATTSLTVFLTYILKGSIICKLVRLKLCKN